MTGPVILFVDDEPLDRKWLQIMLRQAFEVIGVGSAAEARKILAKVAVDAVLVDERMPEESGAQFALWLHRHRPDLPVLTCSGSPQLPGSVRKGDQDWHLIVRNEVVDRLVSQRLARIESVLETLGGMLRRGGAGDE